MSILKIIQYYAVIHIDIVGEELLKEMSGVDLDTLLALHHLDAKNYKDDRKNAILKLTEFSIFTTFVDEIKVVFGYSLPDDGLLKTTSDPQILVNETIRVRQICIELYQPTTTNMRKIPVLCKSN